MSRDPEHTTMSPYAYCANNPLSLIDPTGHSYGGGGVPQSLGVNQGGTGWSLGYWTSNYTRPKDPNGPGVFDSFIKGLFFKSYMRHTLALYIGALMGETATGTGPKPTRADVDFVLAWLKKANPEYASLESRVKRFAISSFGDIYRVTGTSVRDLEHMPSSHWSRVNPTVEMNEPGGDFTRQQLLEAIGEGLLAEMAELYLNSYDIESREPFSFSSDAKGPAHMISNAYLYEYSSRGFFSQVGSEMTEWRSANPDVLNIWQVTAIYYYDPWVSESSYPGHRNTVLNGPQPLFP